MQEFRRLLSAKFARGNSAAENEPRLENTVRLTLKSRRRTQDGRWKQVLELDEAKRKPFDGARDRVKVDQKDLDETQETTSPVW